MRKRREKSKTRRILEWVGFGILAVVFCFAMVAQIDAMVHRDQNWGQQLRFGIGNFVVQTDSMEPDYKVESAIVTQKQDPSGLYARWLADKTTKIDITFSYQPYASFLPDDPTLTNQTNLAPSSRYYGSPMTHRIREIHEDTTKEVGQGRYIFVVAGINTQSEEWKANQYQVLDERYILGTVVLNSDALGKVLLFIASPWGLFGLLLIPAFYLVISSTIDIFRTLKEPEEATANGGSGNVGEISDADRERLKQEMLLQMLEEKKKAKAEKQQEENAEKPVESEDKPAETAPKEEKKEALSGYSDEEKQRLRQQMLAQIMAERAQEKGEKPAKEKKEKPAKTEEAPKEDKGALAGYSDEEKQRLRQQMLAQIMAEKKAAKEAKEVKQEDKDDGKA